MFIGAAVAARFIVSMMAVAGKSGRLPSCGAGMASEHCFGQSQDPVGVPAGERR